MMDAGIDRSLLPLQHLAQGRLEQAGRPLGAERGARAREAASQDFEAVFLSQMLQPLFEGLETEGLLGGGQAEGIYRSILVDEIGKMVARSGGVGIADVIAREMLALQEG